MFPRIRQQLLARADLLVELSTLGEYGVDESGAVMRLEQPVAAPARRQRGCQTERLASQSCASGPGRAASARS